MFYADGKLQYNVRVDKPDPVFARMLQQAIGGIEGEMRVCLQYLFQAWNSRGPKKYRDMLLATGTEEIAHIEMLATAVALNLEGAPLSMQEHAAHDNPVVAAVLGGMDPRHVLSAGLGAMATDANGVPFNGSWVVSSGNIAADMYANVMAESTGRALAVRLHNMTDDHGMKDMLQFLIARDTMHQQQWLAVLEELGGHAGVLPIPNSHPRSEEHEQFAYVFLDPRVGPDAEPLSGRFTSGPALDGTGKTLSVRAAEPHADEPQLAPPKPRGGAQKEEMLGGGILGRAKHST